MKYIYMNEFISDKDADVPVIAVFEPENKRLVYCNEVTLRDRHGVVIGRVKFGAPPKSLPHEAKAWVEIYDFGSSPIVKVDVL